MSPACAIVPQRTHQCTAPTSSKNQPMMKQSFALAILAAALVGARPLNDWGKPCFDGECFYDLPASSGSSGFLKLSGAANAIKDVTPAAGWMILDCDSKAREQRIRLICRGDATGCNHLSQGADPAGTVVRLPESCGETAFARIVDFKAAEDQTIPSTALPHVVRRDGSLAEVKVLHVDTEYHAVDMSKHGEIFFVVAGVNIPGVEGNFNIPSNTALQTRAEDDFVSAGLEQVSNWSRDEKTKPFPINISKNVDILSQTKTCGPLTASLKIVGNAKATSSVVIGVVASGSLVSVDKFGAYATINAELDGSVDVTAELSGTLDSGRKQLVPPVTLPGLNFEVLKVGPMFGVDGQAKVDLALNVGLNVGLAYSIKNAKIYFPSSAGTSSVAPQSKDTGLKLSASPSISAKATVEAHVIPKLLLGVDFSNGKVNATIYAALDVSATLGLSASASTTISTRDEDDVNDVALLPAYVPPYPSKYNRAVAMREPDLTWQGCVDLGAGIKIEGGADATFFKIWDKSWKYTFFSKKFQIYKKCIGNGKREVSYVPRSALEEGQVAALSCPSATVTKATPVASETVKAANIKPVP